MLRRPREPQRARERGKGALEVAVRAALGVIAPPRCGICAAACRSQELVCPRCERALRRPAPPPGSVPGLELAWSALPYEGVARRLVAALKFHGRAPLARRAAEAIVEGAPAGLFGKPPITMERQRASGPARWVVVIVPVPASPSRLRSRGIDPAEEIATALAALIGAPLVRCLVREDGPTQVGRPRSERLRDPPRVHACGAPPPRVLLVDDVLTTGATIAASARALRDAGTRRVAAVTFARTIGRRADRHRFRRTAA